MNNPYRVLGVSRQATDSEIRAAYLAAVRLYPPDRDAAQFDRVQKAYEKIQTHRARVAFDLFDKTPPSADDALVLMEAEFVPRRPDAAALLSMLKA